MNKVPMTDAPATHRRCLWCKRSLALGILFPATSVVQCACSVQYTLEVLENTTEQEWTDVLYERGCTIERHGDSIWIQQTLT